ncbi:MAG: lytic murein transglycosylase [Desulfovibrio sp.]|nr:lytic murein transglycosylase [Desulfovibrio sp.]
MISHIFSPTSAFARWLRWSLCCFSLCAMLPACSNAQQVSAQQSQAANAVPPAAQLYNEPAAQDASSKRAMKIHAVWLPLRQRLAADGLAGPQVDALLATLPKSPTQSPMGRKIRELYMRKFFPKPRSTGRASYYKGVLSETNAKTCRRFATENAAIFTWAEQKYGVPASIAVALLFVETRLGAVLGDVPENAFYTLASMAICRRKEDIVEWLPRLPKHELHADWFEATMPKRADWAYKETYALLKHMIHDQVPPEHLPGSIYGAVGLCQFMPSNIAVYGADGNGDARVDLFDLADAVASLENYLVRHGWRPGLPREKQHKVLMTYNHAAIYANTILALADMVEGKPMPSDAADVTQAHPKKRKKHVRQQQ